MNQKKTLFKCWKGLSDFSKEFTNAWTCDESVYRKINTHYPHLNKKINNFSRTNINRSLGASIPNEWELMRACRCYKKEFQSQPCPYTGEIRRVWFYYRQVGDAEPSQPAQASDIVDEVAKEFSVRMERPSFSTASLLSLLTSFSFSSAAVVRFTQKSSATPSQVTPNRSNVRNEEEEEKDEEDSSSSDDESSANYQNIWWDYKRNAKIFGCDPLEVDCQDVLKERIKTLEAARKSLRPEHLYAIVDQKNEYLTAYQQDLIRQKALFLINAYNYALKRLGHDIKEDKLRSKPKEERQVSARLLSF